MLPETIEARGRTTHDGKLHLSVSIGVPDAEVDVTVHVRPSLPSGEVDANGWPKGFFERVAGSMPELVRPVQGEYEDRPLLG